jgi:Mce-associated membrane protein
VSKTDARERIDVIERPVTDTADATAETQGAASTEDAVVNEDTTTVTDDAEVSPGGSSKNADQATPVAEVQDLKRRRNWSKVLAFGVLPGLAMVLASTAGFLKWQEASARDVDLARIQSVATARDATIAMLSYQPDTVDKQLGAARDLLTGPFRDSYASLTNDVVIPGAKQKQISAVASVPAIAPVAVNSNHAVALVFVDQTVAVGGGAPTDTASTVRVTMDKVGNRWLISGFDPV